jgi:acyl-CoA reductase-like NAD-dependent aldehyde dehydrogenase
MTLDTLPDTATLTDEAAKALAWHSSADVEQTVAHAQRSVRSSRSSTSATSPSGCPGSCTAARSSERPEHRIVETWQPLGVVGLITAFDFPAAAWGWNTALALVCGDAVVWKSSETTPLIALACQALLERAAAESGAPEHLGQVVLGGRESGSDSWKAYMRRSTATINASSELALAQDVTFEL